MNILDIYFMGLLIEQSMRADWIRGDKFDILHRLIPYILIILNMNFVEEN